MSDLFPTVDAAVAHLVAESGTDISITEVVEGSGRIRSDVLDSVHWSAFMRFRTGGPDEDQDRMVKLGIARGVIDVHMAEMSCGRDGGDSRG